MLRGLAAVVMPGEPCAQCKQREAEQDALIALFRQRSAELQEQIHYWRTREERTLDRLLEVGHKAGPVAQPATSHPQNPMALAIHAMGISEIDTTKKKTESAAAGPDAMTRGAAH